jgi:hypothetical protein
MTEVLLYVFTILYILPVFSKTISTYMEKEVYCKRVCQ